MKIYQETLCKSPYNYEGLYSVCVFVVLFSLFSGPSSKPDQRLAPQLEDTSLPQQTTVGLIVVARADRRERGLGVVVVGKKTNWLFVFTAMSRIPGACCFCGRTRTLC
jgi:hypothetical protein